MNKPKFQLKDSKKDKKALIVLGAFLFLLLLGLIIKCPPDIIRSNSNKKLEKSSKSVDLNTNTNSTNNVEQKEEISCSEIKLAENIASKIPDQSLKNLIIKNVTEGLWKPENKKEELCRSDTLSCGIKEIDLNKDRNLEYILKPIVLESGGKREIPLVGASGEGPIFVYDVIDGNWGLIGKFSGTYFVDRLKTNYTKGYRNLTTHSTMGTRSLWIDEWAWNGESYKKINKWRLEQKMDETVEEFDKRKQEAWNKIGEIAYWLFDKPE